MPSIVFGEELDFELEKNCIGKFYGLLIRKFREFVYQLRTIDNVIGFGKKIKKKWLDGQKLPA